MGSGLILLVIVGAWLAVLVPMALRSHDTAASRKSTDRFSDAMRVLSRKGSRDVLVPRSRQTLVVSETRSARSAAAPEDLEEVAAHRPTAAERRRRLLLALLGLALGSLVAGVLGPRALLGLHLIADLLLVAFVVHLRRQAVRRQVASRRGRTPGSAPRVRPVRIAGIPDRMPLRPHPLSVPLPAPAARHEDPLPATGTDGRGWSPVPVPPPVYAGKAVAPPRPPRVLDLTRPGRWSSGEDELAELLDDSAGPDLEEIIDRRRVAGGW